ncbi:MAG: hypothetical protein BWX78_01747 [Firmicutes bacterium ADurb.Bin099]|jgi:hypothetical protein|nr:MAG: hypothetical protein BWX78_01747 [Firmicutes bacterium ADurb.Bin099]
MSEWVYLENEWTFVNLAFVKSVRFNQAGKFQVEIYEDYWVDVEPKIYPTPFLHELMVSE